MDRVLEKAGLRWRTLWEPEKEEKEKEKEEEGILGGLIRSRFYCN
jgi:hypothetical protein